MAQTSCPVKLEAGFVRNCKNTSEQCPNCDTNCINFKLKNLMQDKIVHLAIMTKFDETGLISSDIKCPVAFIYESDDSTNPGKRRDYLWNLESVSASPKFSAWIHKLTFENGSYWKDNGSKLCSVSHK